MLCKHFTASQAALIFTKLSAAINKLPDKSPVAFNLTSVFKEHIADTLDGMEFYTDYFTHVKQYVEDLKHNVSLNGCEILAKM